MQRAFFHKKTPPPVQATRDDGLHRGTTLIQGVTKSHPALVCVLLYCRTSIRLTAQRRFSPKSSHAETSGRSARNACSRRRSVSCSRCFPYSRIFIAHTYKISLPLYGRFVNQKRRGIRRGERSEDEKQRIPARDPPFAYQNENCYWITRTRMTSSSASMPFARDSATASSTSPVTSRMV